ncbi:MAG: FAD-binding oxidoreductase, partial [Alphaproteobacteria bacterium]
MLTRRKLLQTTMAAQAALILPAGCAYKTPLASGPWVNDIHSKLNRTPVRWIHRPTSTEALQAIVRDADRAGRYLSIAGGRHAMGGQQFVTDGDLVDTTAMDRVVRFDRDAGLIEVGAGIQWPGLFDWLVAAQAGDPRPWTFRQKQTGADRLSIGGALAANVHGRGLTFKPFIADIESFVLVGADGEARRCSRRENPELFALAVGGYGLFGAVATVTLRLVPRRKVERVVEIADADGVADAFAERIAAGYLYGDFQFSTDQASDGFLRSGVFSCYRPVDDATSIPTDQRRLSAEDWTDLLYLGHADRARAYERYADYYLTTSGQVYWSDSQQMST